MTVDPTGNVYVTGYTASTDFRVTPGAYQTARAGTKDVFVSKLNPAFGPCLLHQSGRKR